MAYPRELLADGETIELEMREHWRTLIRPVLVGVVTIPVAAFLIARFDESTVDWIVVAGLLVALLLWVVKPVVEWATTEYVITDRRVITRSGVLSRSGRDMPLSKVNDVQFRSGVIDRLFRCGTIVVESAGERGGLTMTNIGDVERVQREIARLHDEDAMRRRRDAE